MRLNNQVRATMREGCNVEIGGFGGLFDLAAAKYRDPILVSGTDGVGTKLRVAQLAGKHDTIGIDLVAMCVNDLVVQVTAGTLPPLILPCHPPCPLRPVFLPRKKVQRQRVALASFIMCLLVVAHLQVVPPPYMMV